MDMNGVRTKPLRRRRTLRVDWLKSGGSGTNRARTCDLMRVKHALFQLSYDPVTAS
jgi:hypothetical protein